ncbi:CDP-alcohol phosphatidyltransferase-domain-containing protein [Dipodascopsis uninucleata]
MDISDCSRQTKSLLKKTTTKTQASVKKVLDQIPKTAPVFRENIYTLPNFLTFTRLISAPLIGYLVLHSNLIWATAVFVYSSITDLLDGYIARKYNLQSVVGSILDPMADKILMITLTGCLTAINSLPLWIAIIIFSRDFLLGLSAIYYRYISLPPPKTFKRYWDFSIPSAEVHPTNISKYNTALQMALITTSLVKPLLFDTLTPDTLDIAQTAVAGLEYIVATTTVLSGLSYVFSKDAVKILTSEEMERRRLKQLTKNKK